MADTDSLELWCAQLDDAAEDHALDVAFHLRSTPAGRLRWPLGHPLLTPQSDALRGCWDAWQHSQEHDLEGLQLSTGRIRVCGPEDVTWPGSLREASELLAGRQPLAGSLPLAAALAFEQGADRLRCEDDEDLIRIFAAGRLVEEAEGLKVLAGDAPDRALATVLEAWIELDRHAEEELTPRALHHIVVLPSAALGSAPVQELVQDAREAGLDLVLVPATSLAGVLHSLEAVGLCLQPRRRTLLAWFNPQRATRAALIAAGLILTLAAGVGVARMLEQPGPSADQTGPRAPIPSLPGRTDQVLVAADPDDAEPAADPVEPAAEQASEDSEGEEVVATRPAPARVRPRPARTTNRTRSAPDESGQQASAPARPRRRASGLPSRGQSIQVYQPLLPAEPTPSEVATGATPGGDPVVEERLDDSPDNSAVLASLPGVVEQLTGSASEALFPSKPADRAVSAVEEEEPPPLTGKDSNRAFQQDESRASQVAGDALDRALD